MQGITTVQMHGGVMQMSHTAVEKCGRRELAEYCLHFHHVGDVKDAVAQGQVSHESYFIGNAVRDGINKGITVHGTHQSLVQRNVITGQKVWNLHRRWQRTRQCSGRECGDVSRGAGQ